MTELKDDLLEQVSGGINGSDIPEMRYDIGCGEAFRNGSRYYVTYSSGAKFTEADFINVRECVYEAILGKYRNIGMSRVTVGFLLSCEYLGQDVILESDIVDGPHIDR